MDIEDIRAIPVTELLARLGHEPKRQRGDECWYLAPYREERTASFQVNVRKNVWHDFGKEDGLPSERERQGRFRKKGMSDGYPLRAAVRQGSDPLSGGAWHLQRCGVA